METSGVFVERWLLTLLRVLILGPKQSWQPYQKLTHWCWNNLHSGVQNILNISLYPARRTLLFPHHALILSFLLFSFAIMNYRQPSLQPIISFLWIEKRKKKWCHKKRNQRWLFYLISLIDEISCFNDVKALEQLPCMVFEMLTVLGISPSVHGACGVVCSCTRPDSFLKSSDGRGQDNGSCAHLWP